jgi:hypothetical protein
VIRINGKERLHEIVDSIMAGVRDDPILVMKAILNAPAIAQ